MAVKRSQSLLRALNVLDTIAAEQPINVSSLARLLSDDRSSVQRVVMTLADAGWIQLSPDPPKRWELSAHLFRITSLPQSATELRQRTHARLESLCSETGETAFLAIPDIRRFVVIDVAESKHSLRLASRIGESIAPAKSSTGRAVLAYLDPARRNEMLGDEADDAELAAYAEARSRGYALSVGDTVPGATNIAAAIFDTYGLPMAAIVISGPSDRLPAERLPAIGKMIARHARELSRSYPHPEA